MTSSFNETIGQSANRPVSLSRHINPLIKQSINQSINQSIDGSISWSTSKSLGLSESQAVPQLVNKTVRVGSVRRTGG